MKRGLSVVALRCSDLSIAFQGTFDSYSRYRVPAAGAAVGELRDVFLSEQGALHAAGAIRSEPVEFLILILSSGGWEVRFLPLPRTKPLAAPPPESVWNVPFLGCTRSRFLLRPSARTWSRVSLVGFGGSVCVDTHRQAPDETPSNCRRRQRRTWDECCGRFWCLSGWRRRSASACTPPRTFPIPTSRVAVRWRWWRTRIG